MPFSATKHVLVGVCQWSVYEKMTHFTSKMSTYSSAHLSKPPYTRFATAFAHSGAGKRMLPCKSVHTKWSLSGSYKPLHRETPNLAAAHWPKASLAIGYSIDAPKQSTHWIDNKWLDGKTCSAGSIKLLVKDEKGAYYTLSAPMIRGAE